MKKRERKELRRKRRKRIKDARSSVTGGNIEHEPDHGSRDQRAHKNTQENGAEERGGFQNKYIFVMPLIDAIAGVSLFMILYQIFNEIGFHKAKWWCLFGALASVEFGF